MVTGTFVTLFLVKLAALTCLVKNQRNYERYGVRHCPLVARVTAWGQSAASGGTGEGALIPE